MPKQTDGGFVDFSDLDPAVSALIGDGQRRQATRTMTKAQKRQAARNRMTFDLSPEVSAALVDMAAELSVPVSQLAEVLIKRGQEHTSMDELMDMRLPARSMRYEFVLLRRDGDTKGRHKGSQ